LKQFRQELVKASCDKIEKIALAAPRNATSRVLRTGRLSDQSERPGGVTFQRAAHHASSARN
jgi:hypothetical protein